jgi:rod shape determining protein RodA
MFQTLDAAAAEKPSRWHSVDGGLVVSALVVCALGLVMIYSATFTSLERAGEDPYFWVNKQVLYAGLGIVTMAALSVIDYHRWIELSLFIYVGTVGVLLGVLSPLGAQQRGIQAFYDLGPLQFQPSEFAKVGLIICLAAFCGNLRGQIDGRRIVTVLLLGSVPMALI